MEFATFLEHKCLGRGFRNSVKAKTKLGLMLGRFEQTRGRARGSRWRCVGAALRALPAGASAFGPDRASLYGELPRPRHVIGQSTIRARLGLVVRRLRGRGVVPLRTAL